MTLTKKILATLTILAALGLTTAPVVQAKPHGGGWCDGCGGNGNWDNGGNWGGNWGRGWIPTCKPASPPPAPTATSPATSASNPAGVSNRASPPPPITVTHAGRQATGSAKRQW